MAVFRFSKYKICYLLMSQPNLCSGDVAIQHKMLSRLLTYRKEKMRLISQLQSFRMSEQFISALCDECNSIFVKRTFIFEKPFL